MNRRGFLTGALSLAGVTLAGPSAALSGTRTRTTVRVPSFLPSANGLHFPNEFPHLPFFRVELPGGFAVEVGDIANGLCGGMVYAARDLFEAGLPPPRTTRVPTSGPMLRYLADRLVDSLALPFGPVTYLDLMHPATPDGDRPPIRGRAWRMIRREWPRIRADLDRGTPSPLALITVKSANPLHVGRNHQVLVWGYDLTGTWLTLRIYDPNEPDNDKITLCLDIRDPQDATQLHYSTGKRVWCFFRTRYTFRDPRRSAMARDALPVARRAGAGRAR